MGNHIYKYEAHHDIATNAHAVNPSSSLPASRDNRLVRRLVFTRPVPSRPISSIAPVAEDGTSWRPFIFRPTPSRRLSLTCGPHIVPRPRAEGRAGVDDDSVAGVMMLAGEYTFPIRSLAHARSLFRIHCVGRVCAPFSSARSFLVPSCEGGGDDGVAVLRFVPSVRPAARVLVSPLCSLSIVHSCCSKQDGGVVSRLPACLVPRPVKSSAPLPVASFASSIPSRSSSRLASRSSSRSHAVSSPVPFSSLPVFLDVPDELPPVLRSRRFVQLVFSFSPCLAVIIVS